MPSRVVVGSTINPLTLLPRSDAERHYADVFYQEINALRSRFVSVAAIGFAAPLLVAGVVAKDTNMKVVSRRIKQGVGSVAAAEDRLD